MNSRERFMAVLDGKIPDRVPSFELLIDEGFRHALFPKLDYCACQEALGFDMVLFGFYGSSAEEPHWVDREKRIFTDKWGVKYQFTTETIPHILEQQPLIDSDTDLANHAGPDPGSPAILKQVRETVARFKGRMAIGFLGEETFAVQQYLRGGLEQLMLDYATGHPMPKKIAKYAADYHCELYRNVIREGVEVIVLGDDYAGKTGPFMSPRHFAEYIRPGLERVVRTCKQAGARVIKHTDGDLWKILDQIVSTGIDALGPLEGLPAMRLSKIKAAYPHLTVVGNVDVDLLSTGTAEEVRQRTIECIADAAPGGRFILSSGNSIASGVQPRLYQALIDAKKEFGAYPLALV